MEKASGKYKTYHNNVHPPTGSGHIVFGVDLIGGIGVTLSCLLNILWWLDSYKIFMDI